MADLDVAPIIDSPMDRHVEDIAAKLTQDAYEGDHVAAMRCLIAFFRSRSVEFRDARSQLPGDQQVVVDREQLRKYMVATGLDWRWRLVPDVRKAERDLAAALSPEPDIKEARREQQKPASLDR